jgi:hypothetical protein
MAKDEEDMYQPPPPPPKTRGVTHCGLTIYIKKYFKAKRRITETQIFLHAKI